MTGAPTKHPFGEDLNWLTVQIGWAFPTWMDRDLHKQEFSYDLEDSRQAELLINMFNALGAAIDRRMAADNLDDVVEFKYYRKINSKATKMKPTELSAMFFMHPEYGKPWMYIGKPAEVYEMAHPSIIVTG